MCEFSESIVFYLRVALVRGLMWYFDVLKYDSIIIQTKYKDNYNIRKKSDTLRIFAFCCSLGWYVQTKHQINN